MILTSHPLPPLKASTRQPGELIDFPAGLRIRAGLLRPPFFLILLLLLFTLPASLRAQGKTETQVAGHWLADHFSERFGVIQKRLATISSDLRSLPVMPDLDALGTHGFHSNFISTSKGNWFQISWDTPQRINGIAVIPTRLPSQSGDRSNYGLPKTLLIQIQRPGEAGFVALAIVKNTRLDLRRGDPIFLDVAPTDVIALRFIPIESPTLPGKGVRFFSLAELMVFTDEVNIAPGGHLSAPYSIDTEVGWNIRYLIDGQSPLGPSEVPIPGHSLGWYSDNAKNADSHCYARIDLREPRRFDSIRLIAARGDAPIKGPGFGFPVRFNLESSDSSDGPWHTLWATGETDFPNPGYNPTTFRFSETTARYVRLYVFKFDVPDQFTIPRVLLSECEVMHDGKNLALGCPVATSDHRDSIPHDATRIWSRQGLTDGFTSTGKIIPTRQWVSQLSTRFNLLCEQKSLLTEHDTLIRHLQNFFLVSSFGLLGLAILGLIFWQMRLRLASRHQVIALRHRISSDLHDEVGSNLATIALLAEMPPSSTYLHDISRLSRETSQSLHDIVEITLASNRARKPLSDRLHEIASLMLCDHQWTMEGQASPEIDLEQRRNLIFYFKESLHNIIRHAESRHVHILLQERADELHLVIEDDGRGIQNLSGDVTENLHTLRHRADSLCGTLQIESAPNHGTRLCLVFPIHPPFKK